MNYRYQVKIENTDEIVLQCNSLFECYAFIYVNPGTNFYIYSIAYDTILTI